WRDGDRDEGNSRQPAAERGAGDRTRRARHHRKRDGFGWPAARVSYGRRHRRPARDAGEGFRAILYDKATRHGLGTGHRRPPRPYIDADIRLTSPAQGERGTIF